MRDETWKEIRAGKVGLDDARQHVDARPLGREHEVDARRPRHLGEALQRLLDVLGRNDHQIRQLVDDHDDVREAPELDLLAFFLARLRLEPEGPVAGCELLVHPRVVLGDAAHAERRHHLVALLHLAHDAAEGRRRPLRIGDDVGDQVGNALVDRELEQLRVDQQQLQLVRRRAAEHRAEQRS